MILALLLLLVSTEVVIDTEMIVAGDVVGFSSSDPRAAVSIGRAPSPGLARRIPRHEIVSKLTSAGFSSEGLEIPDTVLVRRRAAGLDRDQVTQVILDAFLRHYPDANVEIINIDLPAVQVGTGALDLNATLPPRFDPSSSVFVKLEIRGSNFIRNTFVRTSVRIETQQPVLKHPVGAHSSINPGDIEYKLMPARGPVAERFEGLLAKRDLPAGQVVTADLLYSPLFVQKGDAVTVKATAGGITISATMRAKTSGKYGETIQVEHLAGQGITSARITGPRTLEAVK